MTVLVIANTTHAARPRAEVVPILKKGPLAWCAGGPPVLQGGSALRLLVHGVNDKTNDDYIYEVRQFLEAVRKERRPFMSNDEKDLTLARELDVRCYTERRPIGHGKNLYHGLCHVFPHLRGVLPTSLRALHNWETFGKAAEGDAACYISVYAIIGTMIELGFIDEALATWLALDGYLRGQDWQQLRSEDVRASWTSPDAAPQVAILLGRRHRGESVKTGQEQGVEIESPLLSWLIALRVRDRAANLLLFDTSVVRHKGAWDKAKTVLGIEWMSGPHTLRHTGPSEDAASGRRTLADIQRRGRWLQIKSVQRYSKPWSMIAHKARLPESVKKIGQPIAANPRALLERIPYKHPWGALASDVCKRSG